MPGGIPTTGGGGGTPGTATTPMVVGTYGTVVPWSAGRRAIDGAPIWCSEFKQTNETHDLWKTLNLSTGASTLVSFAMAFGYPLVPRDTIAALTILRLWVDWGGGFKLCFDGTNTSATQHVSGVEFVVYSGLPDQTVDPFMLSKMGDLGVLCPGYENLIYIVFKDFPVSGTVLPAVRVEFADAVSISDLYEPFDLLDSTNIDAQGSFVDWKSGEYWGWSATTTTSPKLHKFDLATGAEVSRSTVTGITAPSTGLANEVTAYDPENRLVLTTAVPVSNSVPVLLIDVDGGAVKAQFGVHDSDLTTDEDSIVFPTHGGIAKIKGPSGTEKWVATLGSSTAEGAITVLSYLRGGGALTFGATLDIAGGGEINAVVPIRMMEMEGFADVSQRAGFPVTSQQDGAMLVAVNGVLTMHFFGERAGGVQFIGTPVTLRTFTDEISHIIVDEIGQCVTVITQGATTQMFRFSLTLVRAIGGTFSFFKGLLPIISGKGSLTMGLVLPNAGAAAYVTATIPEIDIHTQTQNSFYGSNKVGGIVAYQGGGHLNVLNTNAGTVVVHAIAEMNGPMDAFYDATTQSALISGKTSIGTDAAWVRLDQPTDSSLTLGDVLLGMALLAGYDEADIEVDAALTDIVLGVRIDGNTPESSTAFGMMERIYDFQTFESQGKIKFKRTAKGETATADVSLTADDVAQIGEGRAGDGDTILTTFEAPSDVPVGIALSYIDPSREYSIEQATFRQNATQDPDPSKDLQQIQLPWIVMTATEAYQRVSRVALGMDELSVTLKFRLPWKYIRFEPADLAGITFHGYAYSVRAVNVTINADMSLSCDGPNTSFSDAATVNSDGLLGTIPQTLPGLSASKPMVLDMPLLDYLDDPSTPLPIVYTGVTSYGQAAWVGASFFRAAGDAPYVSQYHSDSVVPCATVAGTVPTTSTPFSTDDDTTLRLVLKGSTSDDWDTTDADGLRAGANAMVVGKPGRWELIFFRDVTVVADKSITLNGLLRGRRGTEVNCNIHEGGDEVYLLRSVATDFAPIIGKLQYGLDDLDGTFKYKAVGDQTQSAPLEVTAVLTANSLRPWAPCHYVSTLDGSDVVLSWHRRSRYFLDCWDASWELPLAEASEAYEIDIYDGDDVVRTLTSLVDSVSYTDAMQTADGFTAPVATVKMAVYQMSEAVGRGFTAAQTVTTVG